ncbi:MAG: transposase [Planctomycetota bacterium]|nr:transposase [Planctomycetota bacterium]MDA0921791.1 transposase [Planctomycetota bacterium]
MTGCNAERIHFSRVRRRLVADFNRVFTSDAGVLLLREVDRKIGLIDAINDCLPDPRDQRFTIYEQREMIAQRIYSIALGSEDLNDQQAIRDDPALCRLEN